MRRAFAILASLAVATAAVAVADGIAPAQKALLLLRVLAYDRNLKTRAKDELRIAVVYLPGNTASERERDALLASLDEIGGRTVVAGLRVRATAVPYRDAQDLLRRLRLLGPAAIFVGDDLEDAAGAVAGVCRELAVPSVCGRREAVARGIAVGLVDRGERAGLLVNPRAATEQGADLDSALLSIAERIETQR